MSVFVYQRLCGSLLLGAFVVFGILGHIFSRIFSMIGILLGFCCFFRPVEWLRMILFLKFLSSVPVCALLFIKFCSCSCLKTKNDASLKWLQLPVFSKLCHGVSVQYWTSVDKVNELAHSVAVVVVAYWFGLLFRVGELDFSELAWVVDVSIF